MALHRPTTTVNDELAVIDFTSSRDRVFDYFIRDVGGAFPSRIQLRAKAQAGYTRRNIVTTDYLSASIGVPVLSQRAVDALANEIEQDLELHPVLVHCEGEELTFYAGKTRKYLDGLVDQARSTFSILGGARILMKAAFVEGPGSFLWARDARFKERMVVSDEFKRMVESKGLAIGFLPAS